MRRLCGRWAVLLAALTLASVAVPAGTVAASLAASAAVTLRLTGLSRTSRVVAVPEAAMLSLADGSEFYYQGSPLTVPRGTYLIAAEIPTYSGATLTSQTLVFRKVTIGRSETVRLDGQDGRRLSVSLKGAQGQVFSLSANVCMSLYPGSEGVLAGSASAGPGVAVYAVPVKSPYITFTYGDVLTSAGATYYLTGGSKRGQIPSRMAYAQRASGLARLTMELRTGEFGSTESDWSIQAGNGQPCGGVGWNTNLFLGSSWVNYLTPGIWTTTVTFSQSANGYADADLIDVGRYRAGRSYDNIFGGAVVGPGPAFPLTSDSGSKYAQLTYSPVLFYSPVMEGGQYCCNRSAMTLRLGSQVVSKSRGGSISATIRQAGWYTLDVTGRRWLRGPGATPADLLSPQVAVSFRFHASPTPAGNGSYQDLPLTDAQYEALGLNSANQAAAGGTTRLHIKITRPGNDGVATPVYRLKAVEVYASLDGGASWKLLKLRRLHGVWQVTIQDPASGYVAIRSIVTDVHGDRTEQTVYRAYAIAG